MVVLPTGAGTCYTGIAFCCTIYVSPKPEDGVLLRQLAGCGLYLGRMGGIFLCIFHLSGICQQYVGAIRKSYDACGCDAVVVFLYVPAVHRGRNQPISECTGVVYP